MADQDRRPAIALQVLDQFVDQRAPAVGDRMARIVAVHVQGAHVVMLAQLRQQAVVGAGRVAVAMGEMKQGSGHGARSNAGAPHCNVQRRPALRL